MIYVPIPAPEFAKNNDSLGYYNYRSEFTSHLMTFNKRLEESEKYLGRMGRILDIGCVLGHMGEAARRRGWDVYVTDVSEFTVLEARKNFGLNGFISAPDKLAVKPGRFDLITMYDMMEHLSHPLDLLKDVRKALSSCGILHISTSNAQSWSAKIMGRHWYHLKPSEHLLYFTPETLRSCLERTGFEVLKIKSICTYMRINDILLRLERYSKKGARFLRTIARTLGISDWRVKIFTGEMQAWAQPAGIRKEQKTQPVKDILDIVCCSNCRSEIQLFEESEAICTQCELSFEVVMGVINFSKYAKHGKQKVIGSS
ncbi:MAG: hypothetical protein A2Z20_00520 [Bdellovibrionales bacterium RBG_16_40_8]|nr:MAG: hypothetical protein A2Z20_00520 [Bdellovibrionales bacterium RBG_16_40_8]